MLFLTVLSSFTIFLIILVNCTWDSWSAWETCSASCGNGTQDRNRTKNAAKHGGTDCVGTDTESQSCNPNPCPGLVELLRSFLNYLRFPGDIIIFIHFSIARLCSTQDRQTQTRYRFEVLESHQSISHSEEKVSYA